VRDDGIATTVMLGLSGFQVLAVSEHDGEVEQAVETTAEEGWCPSCGVRRGCMIGGRRGFVTFRQRVDRSLWCG
jgi:hypothetical protein